MPGNVFPWNDNEPFIHRRMEESGRGVTFREWMENKGGWWQRAVAVLNSVFRKKMRFGAEMQTRVCTNALRPFPMGASMFYPEQRARRRTRTGRRKRVHDRAEYRSRDGTIRLRRRAQQLEMEFFRETSSLVSPSFQSYILHHCVYNRNTVV